MLSLGPPECFHRLGPNLLVGIALLLLAALHAILLRCGQQRDMVPCGLHILVNKVVVKICDFCRSFGRCRRESSKYDIEYSFDGCSSGSMHSMGTLQYNTHVNRRDISRRNYDVQMSTTMIHHVLFRIQCIRPTSSLWGVLIGAVLFLSYFHFFMLDFQKKAVAIVIGSGVVWSFFTHCFEARELRPKLPPIISSE